MYILKIKKSIYFSCLFQNLKHLLYVAQASTVVLVTEDNNTKVCVEKKQTIYIYFQQ